VGFESADEVFSKDDEKNYKRANVKAERAAFENDEQQDYNP
jgi:hypothetical protein